MYHTKASTETLTIELWKMVGYLNRLYLLTENIHLQETLMCCWWRWLFCIYFYILREVGQTCFTYKVYLVKEEDEVGLPGDPLQILRMGTGLFTNKLFLMCGLFNKNQSISMFLAKQETDIKLEKNLVGEFKKFWMENSSIFFFCRWLCYQWGFLALPWVVGIYQQILSDDFSPGLGIPPNGIDFIILFMKQCSVCQTIHISNTHDLL